VKLFSVDFAGQTELRVPLAVTAAQSGQQTLYVCVRNMYQEDRVGSPGPLAFTVK